MIPVIDVSGLAGGSPDALARIAGDVGRAARGIGFFAVTGHPVPGDLQAGVFDAARTLFALPLADKEALAIERVGNNRGWVRLGGEALDPSRPADLKEAFNIGFDLAPDDPEIVAGRPFRGLNAWPAIPGWRETLLRYFDAVHGFGLMLHRAVATDLGLPAGYFESSFDRPLATLRLLRYPPAPETVPEGAIGAGAHTDYGNLTLLLTDDAGGLEVQTRTGEWITPPPLPAGAYVVNIGDCLMRWTNDVYVSTPHRVVHRAPRERLSVAFFMDPNPDAVVEVIPGCTGPGRPARYAPVTGAEYLAQRLDATYAHRRAGAAG
jgi:isopenicillin N synthase-like dioxygenase